MKTWKRNSWRLKSGGPVTNREDFEKLDLLNAELEVVWVSPCPQLDRPKTGVLTRPAFQMHIPGHAGYHGNEQADRLSREGAAKPKVPEEES